MGKEEVLEALVEFQTLTSVNGFRTHFIIIHHALRDIHCKRWRVLEDACFVVMQRTFTLIGSEKDEENRVLDRDNGAMKGFEMCLEFIEPLLSSMEESTTDALDNEQDVINERGVLVAALLHLFAKISGNVALRQLQLRLVADVLKCGIDVHVVLSTLRFRETLQACCRALLPSYESDTSSDDDEEEEEREFAMQDMQWVLDRVINVWKLTKYRYFLQISGHEHAFSSWSSQGIGNFVHALLADDQHNLYVLPVVVSPFSWLFFVMAYAHSMLRSEDHQDRIRGIDLVRMVISLCPNDKLILFVDKESELMQDEPPSFRDQVTPFRARDWLSPLIHVITNTMVSFHDAKDRLAALKVLRACIFKLVGNDRFRLLRDLIMKCPYSNVSAVLVDFMREDAVQAWSSSNRSYKYLVKTTATCLLIQNILSQAVERDLVLQADLLASCMSLVRFLYIRDKDNETGIRSKSVNCGIVEALVCISKRLQVEMEGSSHTAEAGLHSVENNVTHLMILEAALGSTLELLSKSLSCAAAKSDCMKGTDLIEADTMTER